MAATTDSPFKFPWIYTNVFQKELKDVANLIMNYEKGELCMLPLGVQSFLRDIHLAKCDAIWENLPHVAQDNFAEIHKIIWKLLCFSLFFIYFDIT